MENHGSRVTGRATAFTRAFTLMEIMIVVGIMGIVLVMGVPLVYNVVHKDPMRKAVADIQEVCSHARARAIFQGIPVDVVFQPREGRLAVGGASVPSTPEPGAPGQAPTLLPAPSRSGLAAQVSDKILIEMLDINLREYKDEESARVRFFPNGTSDEMTIILRYAGEWKKITTEVTTGLVDVGNVR